MPACSVPGVRPGTGMICSPIFWSIYDNDRWAVGGLNRWNGLSEASLVGEVKPCGGQNLVGMSSEQLGSCLSSG